MTSTENTLSLAKGLVEEVAALSKKDTAALISFLEKLRNNPYSMVEEANASGEFFASRVVKNRYVLYWSLEYPDNLSLTGPLKVKVLALQRVAERPRTPSIRESQ